MSPYLVPGPGGMKFLETLRDRDVKVRILTNSLASTDMSIVHSGYQAYRVPLLEMGVELYEVRPIPGAPLDQRPSTEVAELGTICVARQGVRVRSSARLRRLDESRPAVAAHQHGNRSDHRQPGARAPDRGSLCRNRAARPTAMCCYSTARWHGPAPSGLAYARGRKAGRLPSRAGGDVLAAAESRHGIRGCRSTSCSERLSGVPPPKST